MPLVAAGAGNTSTRRSGVIPTPLDDIASLAEAVKEKLAPQEGEDQSSIKQSADSSRASAEELKKLTDDITDELFGIDSVGSATADASALYPWSFAEKCPFLTPNSGIQARSPGTTVSWSGEKSGPFGMAAVSRSAEKSGPFEKSAELSPPVEAAEDGETMRIYQSTSEEMDELQSWTSKYTEDFKLLDPDLLHVLKSEHGGLSCSEGDLLYVFWKFIAAETPELEEGVTVLVHDIPFGFKLRPDVTDMIDSTASVDSVGYIYLPVAVDRPKINQFRNKGYCFIHFSDADMAQKFMTGISDYKVPEQSNPNDGAKDPGFPQNGQEEPKKMYAVFAKYQGLSTNLHNLLDIDSKKWRPKNGFACVRTNSGLANISLLGLRILAKRHATSLVAQADGNDGDNDVGDIDISP
jgi:hypothetical protein